MRRRLALKSWACSQAAWVLLTVAISVFVAPELASARSDFLANLGKKADEKYENRWTLADWFETQRKTRLQDMWLKGNLGEDIYDFMIGFRTGVRSSVVDGIQTTEKPRAFHGLAHAYATIFGLEGSYEEVELESWGWDGAIGLRIIGDSQQNSNITLLYGIQHRADRPLSDQIQNQFAKGRLTIYITQAFGIEGYYRAALGAESHLGAREEGAQVEGGAFIDFRLLRVFGAWTKDTRLRTFQAVRSERVRESIDVGLKLFF